MHYTKEEIIGALNNVRRYVCCYASDNYCDCKFGADEGHWKNPHEEKVLIYLGKKNISERRNND